MSMAWDLFLDTVPRSPRCPGCSADTPRWRWVWDAVEGRNFLTHDGELLCLGPATVAVVPAAAPGLRLAVAA